MYFCVLMVRITRSTTPRHDFFSVVKHAGELSFIITLNQAILICLNHKSLFSIRLSYFSTYHLKCVNQAAMYISCVILHGNARLQWPIGPWSRNACESTRESCAFSIFSPCCCRCRCFFFFMFALFENYVVCAHTPRVSRLRLSSCAFIKI